MRRWKPLPRGPDTQTFGGWQDAYLAGSWKVSITTLLCEARSFVGELELLASSRLFVSIAQLSLLAIDDLVDYV